MYSRTNTRGNGPRGRSRFSSGNRKFSHASQGSRGGFRGAPKRRGPADERINPSRFINKVVAVEEAAPYQPAHSFADFAIHPRLKELIAAKGFTAPTPIQDQAIEPILEGKDVVGIANTGTGKTAAFLIPLINRVVTNDYERVLVVVPTRELALQIEEEFRGLSRGSGLRSVVIVGGASFGPQLAQLRYENDFVIGTPGRLKDMIERGKINLADFTTLVLDEADRMLDMGFVNDMRELVAGMPEEHQTLFFSATVSAAIEKLIAEFLHAPLRVSVKTRDTSENVEQDVVRVAEGMSKFDTLHALLGGDEFQKVLVFGRTKHGVEKLAKALTEKGVLAESIHGNKTHSKRQKALGAFKTNKVKVLVATDVAARGLDIPDVSHVINFELPATYDDYVHRIGRTGRGAKRGKALTFIG
ncbi:MAG: DEAD/DEAH box helicase [Patescibacteria group bacterium]|nr:DEAD/DEAH box helicase [Patescibacteria group bacterium]